MRAAFFGILAMAAVATGASAETPNVSALLTDAGAEAAIREGLKTYMKDPNSAQLVLTRKPILARIETKERTFDGVVVCGDLNGKNSYGGYVGFDSYLFIISPRDGSVEVISRMVDKRGYYDAWLFACRRDPATITPTAVETDAS